MNVKWYMSDLHACGYVRGEVTAREVNKQFPNCRIDCKTEVMLSDFFSANIMVWQRSHTQGMLDRMRFAKSRGIKTIYDIDDDMFNMPPEFQEPYRFYLRPEVREGLRAMMAEADIVTVSTSDLAESLSKVIPGKQWWIIENYLDVAAWEQAHGLRSQRIGQKDGPVTIGWMASGSHQLDCPLISAALGRLMAELPYLRLHFIGWIGFQQIGEWAQNFKDRITVQPWLDISTLPTAMANFDIGIAPLADNQFNRCKSSIKVLQYWALGLPVVTSLLPPYRNVIEDGKDGFYAATEQEWYEKLRVLAEDQVGRIGMGALGRAKLVTKYDMKDNCIHWVRQFDRLLKSQ